MNDASRRTFALLTCAGLVLAQNAVCASNAYAAGSVRASTNYKILSDAVGASAGWSTSTGGTGFDVFNVSGDTRPVGRSTSLNHVIHGGTVFVININVDTDTDGAPDPTDPDDDNDTMTDEYESQNGLDLKTDDTGGDLDSDGLTNLEEFNLGTAANDPDTDGDDIVDNLDPDPLTNENACDVAVATFNDDVSGLIVCGAATSITVDPDPATEVQSTGELHLISPTVIFEPGFSVAPSGLLYIVSEDPTPPAPGP